MIEHLSYSSISQWLTCPASWKFKYIDRMPTPAGPALVFGGAWHEFVERFISAKAIGERHNLEDLWQACWEQQVEKQPDVDWSGQSPDRLFGDGIRMIRTPEVVRTLGNLRPLRTSSGLQIEQKVELHVPGVPVPIIGYIDMIEDDYVPCDFKTASAAWPADKASKEIQPLFYLAALNQARRRTPGFMFRHYVFVKGRVQVQRFETRRTLGQMMFLFQMIQKIWKAIEAGVFPENPTAWLCNERYCPFWHNCLGKYS